MMKHRRPPLDRPADKPLAANIGWRAPKELRDRLLALSNTTGFSCNHIAVDSLEAVLDMIYYPDKPLHKIIVVGRALVHEGSKHGINKKA